MSLQQSVGHTVDGGDIGVFLLQLAQRLPMAALNISAEKIAPPAKERASAAARCSRTAEVLGIATRPGGQKVSQHPVTIRFADRSRLR